MPSDKELTDAIVNRAMGRIRDRNPAPTPDTSITVDPTPKAIGLCAKWLQECLHLGWPKSALDDLERLWWQYHDRFGKLKARQ